MALTAWHRGLLCAALAELGCGSGQALLGVVDHVDASAPADAGLGPFGAATAIDLVNQPDANDHDPMMTSDWRELYFASDRSGNEDIWVSRRDGADAAWGVPAPVAELNTSVPDQAPGVSADGLTMWFARTTTPNQPEIWVTTRPSAGQPWSSPTPVAELNTTASQIHPRVDEDSLLMVFESTRSGGGNWQLYSSTRPNEQSTWSSPALLRGLTTGGDGHDPFVASGGLLLWFASTRTGSGDLFTSERPSTASNFAAPVPESELNTPAAEGDPSLSSDLRYIVFASTRSGTWQLYQAWR